MAEEALTDNQKQKVKELYAKIDVSIFFNNAINDFLETLFQKNAK